MSTERPLAMDLVRSELPDTAQARLGAAGVECAANLRDKETELHVAATDCIDELCSA